MRSLIGIMIPLPSIIKYPPPAIKIRPILPVEIIVLAGSSVRNNLANIPVLSP